MGWENRRGKQVYPVFGRGITEKPIDLIVLFDKFACSRTRGTCVFFGNASGPVPPIDPLSLSPKSLFLTRPRLLDYTLTREELLERSSSVFEHVTRGTIDVHVAKEFALSDVVKGHKFMESGQSTGKIVFRTNA